MADKTLTVTTVGGADKTLTFNRDPFAGVRTMTRVEAGGGSTDISVDRTVSGYKTGDKAGQSRPLLSKVVGGAAAAYSLRDLNDGQGLNKVVRVRRDSDNNERDFNAKEVSNGTLQNWTNAQVTPPLDLRELTATGRDGPIIEAAAAYSLRNLSDSYAGSVVDVRRSSDGNTETFTAAEVTDGTLVAWVGAGNNGTVSKWYDQSTTSGVPNARHATNSDPAEQPSIVINGALYSNGISIESNQHLWSPSSINVSLNNISAFVYGAASGGQGIGALTSIVSTGTFSTPYKYNSTQGYRYGGEGASSQPNSDALQLFTLIGSPTIAEGFSNGTSYRTSTASTSSYTGRDIKIGSSANNLITGSVHEVIYYNTDQTDNRTALEANIGEVYGISGIPAYDNTVNGFVETWYDQSGNGNNATQATASNQPKIVNAGMLVAPRHLRHTSTVTLPDASQGTQAGKGFTITGLTYDASENCFWAINFGDTIEPVSSTLYPSVVKLSLSFSIISEIDLTPFVSSSTSAQGIAVDTSNNSLWIGLAPSTNDVLNISKQGTLLNTVSLPDSNGLAYDPTDDTLWTIAVSPAPLNHYSKTGTLLDSYSVPFSGADQLAYDAATDSIWCSNGGNGSIGNVSVFHKDTEQWDDRIPLSEDTKSIEGIAIVGSKLFVGNDGYFHSSASTNTIQTFNISNDATIDFSAANVHLTVDTLSEELTGASTAITVLRYPLTSTQIAFSGTSSNSRRTILRSSGKYALFAGLAATTAPGIGQPSEVPSLAFGTFSGTGLGSLYGDGVLRIDQQPVGSYNQAGLTIGQDDDGSPTFTGQFYELLLYNSDQSANRLAIEDNINNQYGIYTPTVPAGLVVVRP